MGYSDDGSVKSSVPIPHPGHLSGICHSVLQKLQIPHDWATVFKPYNALMQLILALIFRFGNLIILANKLEVKFSHVFISYKDTH